MPSARSRTSAAADAGRLLRRLPWPISLAVVVLVLVLGAIIASPHVLGDESGAAQPAPGSALAALDELPVKGRAPMTGYEREQFGPAWADVDRNGCDTRNDILARDLDVTDLGANCWVLAGVLDDPYTGDRIDFVRGQGTSSEVQIDHVVALADAWQKGAQQLSAKTRRQLANDPMNLLAVAGRPNSQKGAGDAATWLPPNSSYRCAYVARQVAVKQTYSLWITKAEKSAIERVLEACPNEPLPTRDGS